MVHGESNIIAHESLMFALSRFWEFEGGAEVAEEICVVVGTYTFERL